MYLPQELIERIITSNTKKIVSILAVIKINQNYLETVINQTQPRIKRMKTMTTMKKTKNNLMSFYLVKYYKKSNWLKHFILEDDTLDKIKKKISNLIGYFHLINQSTNYSNTFSKPKKPSNQDYSNVLEFENAIANFIDTNYEVELCKLGNYYKITIDEIPDFIKLMIMLHNSGYLSKILSEHNHTHICELFLSIINHMNKNNLHNNLLDIPITSYYHSKYKFIPLIESYCGMGYTFIIGWDLDVSRMIGFLEGGSDAHSYDASMLSIMKYFNKTIKQRKSIVKIKNNKIKDYLKILEPDLIDSSSRITYMNSLSLA
jgi:hypothetical protein